MVSRCLGSLTRLGCIWRNETERFGGWVRSVLHHPTRGSAQVFPCLGRQTRVHRQRSVRPAIVHAGRPEGKSDHES